MNLRRLAVACLVVAVLVAAGCLGIGGDEGDLRVTGVDGDWTESGTLEIEVTVRNAGSAEGTATVLVWADVDGDETYTDRRDVTLAPAATETFTVAFEPPADAVGSGFGARARTE